MPAPTKSKPNVLFGDRPDSNPTEPDLKSPIHQSQILPQTIKQRHIEANNYFITFGLIKDIPDGSTYTRAYFATDENKLYIFNGTWKSATFS